MSVEINDSPVVRRPNEKEILHITKDSKRVILHPYDVAPDRCVVLLREGDQIRISHIPAQLMVQYRMPTEDTFVYIGNDMVRSVYDHTAEPVSLSRFADCDVPMHAVVTRLEPSIVEKYRPLERLYEQQDF